MHFSTNQTTEREGDSGLRCLIVGGGVGGLAAAISLRSQGHHVKIYEKDAADLRIGAGLSLFLNALNALKRLGVKVDKTMLAKTEKLIQYKPRADGTVETKSTVLEQTWLLYNIMQYDLVASLKTAAMDPNRPGPVPEFYASTEVRRIDPFNAVLYLANGTQVQGDLIVGADGVHSMCRPLLSGAMAKPFRIERGAFRGTITRQELAGDPMTREFIETPRTIHHLLSPDQVVHLAPILDGESFSVRCTYLDRGTMGDLQNLEWTNRASKNRLIKAAQGIPQQWLRMLDKVDSTSIQHVPVWDMDPLNTWQNNRMVVIGDAAHPMPPWYGQRCAMALEDAIALGVVLERGSMPESVKERLGTFARIRKNRIASVHSFLREVEELPMARVGDHFDTSFFYKYITSYDEYESSIKNFRAFKVANPAAYPTFEPSPAESPPPTPRRESIANLINKTNPWFKFTFAKVRRASISHKKSYDMFSRSRGTKNLVEAR